MFHVDECASRSNLGRIAIGCPFCKNPVFGAQGVEEDGVPKLKWLCVHCNASFTSNPPYEDSGESRESFKEKIIQRLLEEGNSELIIKVFATSSKRPPILIEEALRDLLSGV